MNGTFAARVTFIDNKVCLISVSTLISSVFVELRAVNSSFLLADICHNKKSKKSLFSLTYQYYYYTLFHYLSSRWLRAYSYFWKSAQLTDSNT